MKLYDLKEIIISEFCLKDVNLKWERTLRMDIKEIQDKYLKQIKIISIDRDNIIFNVADFINANKKEIKNFYVNSSYDNNMKEYLINSICESENILKKDLSDFLIYDLLNFLIGE